MAVPLTAAKVLIHCRCGEFVPWTDLVEDPAVAQPEPYEAQRCPHCGHSLAAAWGEFRQRLLARASRRASSAFPRMLGLSVAAGVLGALPGAHLFGISTAGALVGGGLGFLCAFGLVFALANVAPSVLAGFWGHGHGRCPCGRWLHDDNRVDGFLHPRAAEMGDVHIALWRCPACDELLQSEVSYGSFV